MDWPGRLPLLATVACGSPAAWGQATETTVHTKIHDIRGPIEVGSLPPFVLSGGMLLLIAGLFIARHHVRRLTSIKTLPATERLDARHRLAILGNHYRQGLCTGVDLIIRLDLLVREILASNTGVSARHLTSDELRHQAGLTGMLSESQQMQFDGFLALCDRVKFACNRPASPEIDAAMRTAGGLLDAITARQTT